MVVELVKDDNVY